MRTINFSEEDIKQCKLALAKQNLTSLQSAFLMQHITNIEQENEQLKDNWNKLKEYIKETKLKEFEKKYGKRYGKTFTQAEIIVCNIILDRMQELEGSDSNVKD